MLHIHAFESVCVPFDLTFLNIAKKNVRLVKFMLVLTRHKAIKNGETRGILETLCNARWEDGLEEINYGDHINNGDRFGRCVIIQCFSRNFYPIVIHPLNTSIKPMKRSLLCCHAWNYTVIYLNIVVWSVTGANKKRHMCISVCLIVEE